MIDTSCGVKAGGACNESPASEGGVTAAALYEAVRRRRRLNFDHESTRAHFIESPPAAGDVLILAMFQFHRQRYRLVRVLLPSQGRQRRIVIDKGCAYGGASYQRSGKSGFSPKGQTILLPYVESIAALLSFESDTDLSDERLAEHLGA